MRIHGTNAAEFAVLVADKCQQQGIGSELLRRLVQVGRDEELALITGDILPENRDMQEVCRRVGFRCEYSEKEQIVKAEISLV